MEEKLYGAVEAEGFSDEPAGRQDGRKLRLVRPKKRKAGRIRLLSFSNMFFRSARRALSAEISLQKPFEAFSMPCFILAHLVNGVVDRVKVQLLGKRSQILLALRRAVLRSHSELQVLLCAVGHALP